MSTFVLKGLNPFVDKSSPLLRSETSTSAGINLTRKLEGRVVVVTASTEGIGYAIADRLAEDGAKVMICSRKSVNVDKALESLTKRHGKDSVEGVVCHVGKDEDRKKLIQETITRFGKINILVSNAAANPTFGPILETPEAAWDKIFDINVKSAAMLIKEAHPHLKETNGNVVLVSSIGGYDPLAFLGPYSVSKTALFGLTRVMAVELAPDNIRVNCIAPGVIKTKLTSSLWSNETASEEFMKLIPLNRFGEPNDCAGVVSFMCSDDASYMTGETITVAGGMRSRL